MSAEPTVCQCGKVLPESCGFHPEGEECYCIGSICSYCLAELLGHSLTPLDEKI